MPGPRHAILEQNADAAVVASVRGGLCRPAPDAQWAVERGGVRWCLTPP